MASCGWAKDNKGRTALDLAIKRDHPEAKKILERS